MNANRLQQAADPTLKAHLDAVAQNNQLSSKAAYSLACIASALAPTNSSRNANASLVLIHLPLLLRIAASAKDCSQDHLLTLFKVLNRLGSEMVILVEEEKMLMEVVGAVNVDGGSMTSDLWEEIRVFYSRANRHCENTQFLLRTMPGKMTQDQIVALLQSIPKHQLFQMSLPGLIQLANNYPSDKRVLKKVLEAAHWYMVNSRGQDPQSSLKGKKVASFLSATVIDNLNNTEIMCLCGLVYRQMLSSKKESVMISKNIDIVLKEWIELPISRPYLGSKDKLVSQFGDLLAVMEANVDIGLNADYHYLLNHYARTHFPWKSELSAHITQKLIQKELLLRTTESFEQFERGQRLVVTQKEELAFAPWIPISCIRSVEGLLKKVEIGGSFQAMEAISIIQKLNRGHPRFEELLIILVEKTVQHREFESLKQIERIVLAEVDAKTVVNRLKEKGSVHNVDSNRQSRRYIAFVPLLLSKGQAEVDVPNELGSFFRYQTVSIQLKLYITDFLIRKMVYQPLKQFAAFLTRAIESSGGGEVLKAIIWYLKGFEGINKATIQWVGAHFQEEAQRLLEIVFSMLIGSSAAEATKVLFELQKLGVYGRSWVAVYRWVVLALEEPSNDALTLDFLQLFEMLVEKIRSGGLPESIVEKFERTVAKNWETYTHEHYFAIERIVVLLNQSTMVTFRKHPQPIVSDLLKAQQQFDNSMNRVGVGLDPTSEMLKSLAWNLVFQHVDSGTVVKTILSVFRNVNIKERLRNDVFQKKIVSVLQIMLYVYEDRDEIVESQVDQFVLALITNQGEQESNSLWKIWGYALEYLSRVPHSMNILKLPLSHILSKGFNEGQWIGSITDLLEIVIESRPKAIGGFKLQEVFKSILVRMIALEGDPLEDYLDLLDVACSAEGDYQTFLSKNLKLLERMLTAERQGVGYRSSLVKFVLRTFLDYDYNLKTQLVWFLFNKYGDDFQVVDLLLQYLETKDWKGAFDQQLMMRIVLTHTQDDSIQEKCRKLFNTNVPASNLNLQFTKQLGQGNYAKCEELLQKNINPFLLSFSLPEVKGILQCKDTDSTKKLVRFLYDHPDTNNKIHSCEAFYMNKNYIPLLTETLSLLKIENWFDKFISTPVKGYCTLKSKVLTKTIYTSLTSIMKNKSASSHFKAYLIDMFRNNEDAVGTLTEVMALTLGDFRLLGESSNATIEGYYKYCREIVGEWQLIDQQKVNRYNLKQLIYIFPYPLSQVNANNLNMKGLLMHYLSLMKSFKVIKNEVGVMKYVQKVREMMIEYLEGQDRDIFIEGYLKIHIGIENLNEMIWEEPKEVDSKKAHINFLSKMVEMVNHFLQDKMIDSSAKLTFPTVSGYVTTLLHSVSLGFDVDPPSLERLLIIDQNMDNYGFQENNRITFKQSISWLIKKADNQTNKYKEEAKQSHGKLKEQNEVNKYKSQVNKNVENVEGMIKQKNNEIQGLCQVKSVSEGEYGSLCLYSSLKPSIKIEKNQIQLKKEAEQSYIRYKESEEHVTIREKQEETKTTVIVMDSEHLFEQDIEKPLETSFNEEKFYMEIKTMGPSEEERLSNLQLARKIEGGEFSIQSLKDHCKFISFVADLSVLSPNQFAQILISLDSITQTVESHSFYVKKVADSETIFKLIRIYKNLHLAAKRKECTAVIIKTLKLCVAMAQKKEKKLHLFGDEESIQYFKLVAKRALNGEENSQQIQLLLQVLYSCKNNTDIYYRAGLYSMIVELVNRNVSADLAIDYMIRIDLNSHLINQIYQRGLFTRLLTVVGKVPETQEDRSLLNLWVKLAGKVCINRVIQQRFRSKDLHVRVWQLFKRTTNNAERLNLCYFYSYLCVKNEGVCEWLIEKKVLEELLGVLKEVAVNQELYLLFYHFCFNNQAGRDYCFRLKYHLHLLERITEHCAEGTSEPPLTKYFYKSLGQMMSSKHHIPIFLKEEVVSKLIESYNIKAEPAVYECLLDFISILDTESEFDSLKKEHFWDCLRLFDYKVSNEATYSYLLQIFLVMIKKGRTREFNQPEVRSKICLKAEYSINMDGKELALRFILALSIKNKENYLTERCVKLLESIMGLKVSNNELQLASDILKIQGTTKNIDFLAYFATHNIDTIIIDSLQTLPTQAIPLAISILTTLCANPGNNKRICLTAFQYLPKAIENGEQTELFKESIKLIAAFSNTRQNIQTLAQNKASEFISSASFLSSIKNCHLQQQYNFIVNNFIRNQVVKGADLKKIVEAAEKTGVCLNKEMLQMQMKEEERINDRIDVASKSLREGRNVKMYKADGSVSQLLIFISSDCLEVNCGLKLSEVVKQKWRLPINEITKCITYEGQESQHFKSSLFQKNSGFFTKAPSYECCLTLAGKNKDFYICFNSKKEMDQWMVDLKALKENVSMLLSKLK